jgi:hypothetical protein
MLAWFLVVGLVSGCVVVKEPETLEPGTGEVEVSWQVASSGCEASGVTEVAVEIGGVGGSYDCAAESAVLTVPAGTHDLFIAGYDASGIARYGGESPAVTVIGGQAVRVPTVVLGALPASITSTWSFDNGMLCAQNGVEEIEMIVYDNDFIEDQSVAPCDSGELTIADIRAGAFVVSLLGRDASQQVVYSGEAQVALEKGDNEIVHIQLVPQ